MRLAILRSLAVSSVLALTGSVFASPVPWSSPNGTTLDYDYFNGQSANGLFGNPTVFNGSFLFFPQNFKAVSSNGTTGHADDSVSFDISVKNGKSVTGITVNEIGDYSITGTGTVNIGGSLSITDLSGPPVTTTSLLTSTPGSPITTTTSATGNWSATATTTNLPNGWTVFHVNLTNILDASSTPGGVATVQKKIAQGAIEVSIIVPEPASIGLLAAAGSALLGRRRRNS